MLPYFSKKFGNPSSIHFFGREAKQAVSEARKEISKFFGTSPRGVIFLSSATEANNFLIWGIIKKLKIKNQDSFKIPHIITTQIEHDSVLNVCRALEEEGLVEVSYIGVSQEGIVNPKDIERNLKDETVLVSVMYANNEIGTIQPIAEISKIIRDFRDSQSRISGKILSYPLFHTDAVQAVQFLDCNFQILGVDIMTISSHKIYGPKGAAALLIKDDLEADQILEPTIFGGGQEYGLRSGTENVPAIVGFKKAIEILKKIKAKETKRILTLRDYFIENILRKNPQRIYLNGSKTLRLPNNANISFLGIPSDIMITILDRYGISVSSGSACQVHSSKPSHVLRALGLDQDRIESAIRFSFGRHTSKKDLDYVIKIVAKLLK
jgi:cysteine desulfurase